MADESDPLDVTATAARLRALHRAEVYDGGTLDALLERAASGPDAAGWRHHIDRLSLELGSGLVVAGVIYFFAGNWAALPGLAKIGGVAALVAAAAGWALWAPNRVSGRVALTAAGGLVGALLAVYGQVYQTGADAWTLFATWAVLLVPWLFASRYPPLVLKWLGIGALAVHLAIDQGVIPVKTESVAHGLLVAAVPAAAWIAAEILKPPRYFLRTVAIAFFVVLTAVMLMVIFDRDLDGSALVAGAVLGVAGARALGWLGGGPLDLVLASAALTSAVVLFTAAFGRFLFEGLDAEEGGLLVMAAVVIGQVAASAYWLRARWLEGAS